MTTSAHVSDEDRHLRGNAAFVFAALGDDWGTASFESHGASDSKDVQLGREHNDICERLRSEIDKARKEYNRRFRAIQDHPVDYFHRRMVEILAGGNIEALGDYPYPSPALRHWESRDEDSGPADLCDRNTTTPLPRSFLRAKRIL